VHRLGCFAIELHEEEYRDIFFQAIGRENYEIFTSFELTIARRAGDYPDDDANAASLNARIAM
jgi:hypothetical protein